MKKVVNLEKVPVGETFEVWNRKFTVLEKNADMVFVLAAEIETKMPFREDDEDYKVAPNDFRDSSIKKYLNGEYLNVLERDGANIREDILPLVVDLKCTLGQHEYGTDKVKAGLFTLEQYGEYYDIIPKVDDWWYLATPWKTPLRSPNTNNTNVVWYVFASGGYIGYYYNTYGVRPALNLSPSLLVAWEDEDCEEDTEEAGDWDDYIKYLRKWADEHSSKEFEGCCPVCYDEWKGCEGSEEK